MICWLPEKWRGVPTHSDDYIVKAIKPSSWLLYTRLDNGDAPKRRASLFHRAILVAAIWLLPTTGAFAQAGNSVSLVWDPSTNQDLAGYTVYYGVASGIYTSFVTVGNVTNATITGLVAGTTYYFAATALTLKGLESLFSNELSYTVPGTPPTIALTAPSNGANYVTPAVINLAAAVTANGHTITKVQFFNGPTLLGEDASLAYTLAWTQIVAGTYTLSARVVFDAGSVAVSAPVQVVVTTPPPTVTLTSPASGTVYSAPATVNLAATVVTNAHAISKVQFFSGTTLLGEDNSVAYTFVWTNVSAGNYSLSARVVYDGTQIANSSPDAITVTALTPPWQTANIGSVGVAGTATVAADQYTVLGAGNISGIADNFRFLYQPGGIYSSIQAQIGSVQNTNTNGFIGLMLRETLASGSMHVMVGISSDGTFQLKSRNSTGGTTTTLLGGAAAPPNSWARLQRVGNVIYCFSSIDGTNWIYLDSPTIAMAANIDVGFAVGSGNPNLLATALFRNLVLFR